MLLAGRVSCVTYRDVLVNIISTALGGEIATAPCINAPAMKAGWIWDVRFLTALGALTVPTVDIAMRPLIHQSAQTAVKDGWDLLVKTPASMANSHRWTVASATAPEDGLESAVMQSAPCMVK